MPVDLNTISVHIKSKRKSVYSHLKVKPSFKKLKLEYLGQGNEENQKINSLCAEMFTFTSFPSQIERNISKCQSQESEAHLKESKFRSEKNTMKFIETMSEVDMLGRL